MIKLIDNPRYESAEAVYEMLILPVSLGYKGWRFDKYPPEDFWSDQKVQDKFIKEHGIAPYIEVSD